MKKLKEKRKNSKLTMKELGEKVGVTYKTIYHYEAGKREPNFRILKKFAEIFDCTIDDLID